MGRNWRGWSDVNIYADLFLTFAKIGVCTFGGGYAMLPILQRELVEKRGWATEEELSDYFAMPFTWASRPAMKEYASLDRPFGSSGS